ncbi:MAG: hypothetical protein BGO26_18430 [Actinobacteria bacterium 69-20]|nr:MAG: hypothetical protein BGO26_18430 [Actinobacteria bacterium 69-20]
MAPGLAGGAVGVVGAPGVVGAAARDVDDVDGAGCGATGAAMRASGSEARMVRGLAPSDARVSRTKSVTACSAADP